MHIIVWRRRHTIVCIHYILPAETCSLFWPRILHLIKH